MCLSCRPTANDKFSVEYCRDFEMWVRVTQGYSSSSRMRVIYHNWSAMKQRPHPQSVAEISHH